jgi:fluoride exporter
MLLCIAMVRILLVGLGGFIGSIARYLLSGLAQNLFHTARFPVGTVIVNLSGCFAIGLLSQLAESQGAFRDLSRAFVFIGILGGYTTFSTFTNESLGLFRSGDSLLGLLNAGLQVFGGLAMAWLGRVSGELIWR